MISDERLQYILTTGNTRGKDAQEMAKELLALLPCRHHWNLLRLVESGGRYQYCTLCGAKRVAQ